MRRHHAGDFKPSFGRRAACSRRWASKLIVATGLCTAGCGVFAQCAPPVFGATGLCATGRPETGAYLGNQRQSSMLFMQSLHDRTGEFDNPDGKRNPFWLRTGGEGARSDSSDGQFHADSRGWFLQGGADIARWSLWGGGLHVGALGSYGSARTDASARGSPFEARGETSGYGLGAYATWYQNDQTRMGWYADFWGQYAWFDDKVDLQAIRRVDYKSHVAWASAEGGYAMRFAPTSDWVLEPQGQFAYVHNHSYNVTQSDGTVIEGAHRGGWMSRLGVRVRRSPIDNPGMGVRPFAAFNWWHDHSGDEVVFNNQVYSRDLFPSNRYEVAAGVDVAFGRGWAGWGNVGWQWGSQSYQAWSARAGMKYAW